jgi:hypothetical protein
MAAYPSEFNDKSAKKRKLEELPKTTSKARTLTDLPTEILIKIINNLTTRDVVRNVSLVSKQFNVLANDSSVEVTVKMSRATSLQTAKKIFNRVPHRMVALHVIAVKNEDILQMVADNILLLGQLKTLIIS